MRKDDFDKFNEHKHQNREDSNDVAFKIKKLLDEQNFAVLSSRGAATTYSSLVGFSVDKHFKKIIFATPNYTRKFQLLREFKNISMLVDNRSEKKNRVSEVEAVTGLGIANQITEEDEARTLKSKLLKEHSYLTELVNSDSCSLFLVAIKKYFYVTHIQEVYEWTPE